MKTGTVQLLKKNKKQLQANWVQSLLANDNMQQDLLNEEELHQQSGELLDAFLKGIATMQVEDLDSAEYNEIKQVTSDISLLRARRGFSPRETGNYVLGLKKT